VTGLRFVDTNLLLYSISRAPDEAEKRARAIDILDAGGITMSVQVLQEFYVQATRPTRADRLAHDVAAGLIVAWCRFPVAAITRAVLERALEIVARHRLGYWDAAIIATALEAGCSEVLTEDLQHGQLVFGVRIVDPFRG
jgi:predicted nucleic acid-binding protein